MKCEYCGRRAKDGQNECERCGAPLDFDAQRMVENALEWKILLAQAEMNQAALTTIFNSTTSVAQNPFESRAVEVPPPPRSSMWTTANFGSIDYIKALQRAISRK